jgi:hypothetical protein
MTPTVGIRAVSRRPVPGHPIANIWSPRTDMMGTGAPRRVWRLLHLGCAIAARKRRIAPESSGSDTWEDSDSQAYMSCGLARGGSSAAVERTVSVTAPTGPVRGYFCPRPWPPKPAAHRRIADGGGRRRSLERCMRWSRTCDLGKGERSVKPSAQPTLVRTQHLPPPAKTPR